MNSPINVGVFTIIAMTLVVPGVLAQEQLQETAGSVPMRQLDYLGDSGNVHRQLVGNDVHWSDLELNAGVAYIVYARVKANRPSIYVRQLHLADHTLSAPFHVSDYHSLDHFSVRAAIDDDAYLHLVWGTFKAQQIYVRAQRPKDISSWTEEELFCDRDATYQNLRAHGDTIYNLYRDGSHGQGWKLIWKARSDDQWHQVKLVSGDKYAPKHPYLNAEAQWLFEDPDHQYLAIYWTNDAQGGERRFQRLVRYDLSAQKFYHLNGKAIGYDDGSLVPHQGPYDFYGQCGDFISDDLQKKHGPPAFERNRLGRLLLAVGRTGESLVVLSNIGENSVQGFPPRGLRASVWNGSSWSHRLLKSPSQEDSGATYIQNVRGPGGESLWLVHRKPVDQIYASAATDITILRNTNDGGTWSYEYFTDDDARWCGYPEAVWSAKTGEYVLAWGETAGDRAIAGHGRTIAWGKHGGGTRGHDLYIGFKKVSEAAAGISDDSRRRIPYAE